MDISSPTDIFCISPLSDPGEHPLCLESSTPLLLGIPGASELSFSSDDPFLVLVCHPLLTHQLLPGFCTCHSTGPSLLSPFCKINYLFWLRWAFIAAHSSKQGLLSSCSAQAYHCSSFFTFGAPTLGHWASVVEAHGLQSAGSVAVAQGFCCPEACGIFPDKGWNRCLLLCKADS